MKTIKVKGCKDCPCWIDFDSGARPDSECGLDKYIEGVPQYYDDNVLPKDCPLKKEPIKIELDNEKGN